MATYAVFVNGSNAGKVRATSEAEAETVFRIVHNSDVSKLDNVKAVKA